MEEIQEYGIGFDVDQKSYNKIKKFEDRMLQMYEKIEKASKGMQMPSGGSGGFGAGRSKEARMEKMRADALADVKRNLEHITSEQREQMMLSLSQIKDADELSRKIKDQKKALRDQNNSIAKGMSDTAKEQARMDKLRINTLSDVKRNLEHITKEERDALLTNMKTARSELELRNIIKDQKKELMAKNKIRRSETAELKKQHFLLQRMDASSKQFAGNMISAFAAVSAGAFVTNTGQNFESVKSTMLAVSSSSEEAGKNLQFVKDQAARLGLGLQESGKGFAKMLSAKGNMSLDQVEQTFLGVAEMGTLLGLSADESGRALNAVQQMMSKGVVSAEELKLQLGEVLPNAIQIMAKSAKDAGLTMNGTVKEMMDLQMQGGLISEKVLPHFAKNMRDAAAANGALELKLKSNRVAMNRLNFATAEAAETTFSAKFGEGLTTLFNTLSDNIRDLEPLFKGMGRILGSVFKVISVGVDLITPPLRFVGVILDSITETLGDFSFLVNGAFGVGIMAATGKLGVFAGTLATIRKGMFALLAPIMKVVFALGLVEELLNLLVFKDKEGFLFDANTPDKNTLQRSMGDKAYKEMEGIVQTIYGKPKELTFMEKMLPSFLTDTFLNNKSTADNTPKETTVVLQVDKEKLGSVVIGTESFEGGVGNVLYPIFR